MENHDLMRALEFHGFAPFLKRKAEEHKPSFPGESPRPNQQDTVHEAAYETLSATLTVDPQQVENLEAALFLTKELLERAAFSKLEITDPEAQRIAREATLERLPSSCHRVNILKARIKKSLVALKRERRATTMAQRAKASGPKRPRMRPSLCFDHKRRIPPSKAIECAGELSEDTECRDTNPNPEDEMIAIEARLGSESQDALSELARNEDLLDKTRTALSTLLGPAALVGHSCSQCGKPIPVEKPRSTILRVNQPSLEVIGSIERIAVHCEECQHSTAQGGPKAAENPYSVDLSPDEYFAYCLQKQGVNQAEIGTRMTPPRSQAAVSRMLKRVQEKHKIALLQKLRITGGA